MKGLITKPKEISESLKELGIENLVMPAKSEIDIRYKVNLLYVGGKITLEQYSKFDSDTRHYPTIPLQLYEDGKRAIKDIAWLIKERLKPS